MIEIIVAESGCTHSTLLGGAAGTERRNRTVATPHNAMHVLDMKSIFLHTPYDSVVGWTDGWLDATSERPSEGIQ